MNYISSFILNNKLLIFIIVILIITINFINYLSNKQKKIKEDREYNLQIKADLVTEMSRYVDIYNFCLTKFDTLNKECFDKLYQTTNSNNLNIILEKIEKINNKFTKSVNRFSNALSVINTDIENENKNKKNTLTADELHSKKITIQDCVSKMENCISDMEKISKNLSIMIDSSKYETKNNTIPNTQYISDISLFKNCNDLDSLNKRYKLLIKIYHPDNGGDNEMFNMITSKYNEQKNKLL